MYRYTIIVFSSQTLHQHTPEIPLAAPLLNFVNGQGLLPHPLEGVEMEAGGGAAKFGL